jgi:hypothetical protein
LFQRGTTAVNGLAAFKLCGNALPRIRKKGLPFPGGNDEFHSFIIRRQEDAVNPPADETGLNRLGMDPVDRPRTLVQCIFPAIRLRKCDFHGTEGICRGSARKRDKTGKLGPNKFLLYIFPCSFQSISAGAGLSALKYPFCGSEDVRPYDASNGKKRYACNNLILFPQSHHCPGWNGRDVGFLS